MGLKDKDLISLQIPALGNPQCFTTCCALIIENSCNTELIDYSDYFVDNNKTQILQI